MKKNLYELRFLRLIGIFIFLFGSWGWLKAQTELFKPMPFQELLIDYGGETVIRTEVGIRVTLLQGVDMDSVVYQETHNGITTNNNGMVSFVIGDGLPFKGAVFKAIDFADGPYFIKREYDLNGGSDYTIENISQMVSVPFAFYSPVADTAYHVPYPWVDSIPAKNSLLITNGDQTYSWIDPVFPPSGMNGQILGSKDSSATWLDVLPDTTNNINKILGYDGNGLSWMDSIYLTGLLSSQSSGILGSADGTTYSFLKTDTLIDYTTGTKGQILSLDTALNQIWVDNPSDSIPAALPTNIFGQEVLTVVDSASYEWKKYSNEPPEIALGPNSLYGGVVVYLNRDSSQGLVAAFHDLGVSSIDSLNGDTLGWYIVNNKIGDINKYPIETTKRFLDWRLPTEYELSKILESEAMDSPAIPGIVKEDGYGYWTSIESDNYQVVPAQYNARAAVYNSGESKWEFKSISKVSTKMRVRPVRIIKLSKQ